MKDGEMVKQSISEDQIGKMISRFKKESEMNPEIRLSNQQLCEDLLEIIGVPTHTRKELCAEL
ncbi:hypothetical protein [Vibrio vulnificus]|uniref:hypothetical protein n=1 Tax=Vibrio vulnificus TaxID=672 RepID=UPI001593DA90|nr:hypothetical protein [Vibrio vulnificus]EJE8558865.1 hypothetical protein [Vibrio vulnificus]NVD22992.1 hypothetical protein [Vibrio vulnificus]